MYTATQSEIPIRALAQPDLDAVVAIDAAHSGLPRRAYFERRLQAAIKQPSLHVQLAAVDGQGVAGYILARRTEGEFGRLRPCLRLEVLGVRTERQGHGVGRALLDALRAYGQGHAVAELRTAASWKNHGMMRWLDAMAFDLSGDLVLECTVGAGFQEERNDALDLPASQTPGHETDYGAPEGNDYERVERAHCDVRAMLAEDLPQILRIDREITGRGRGDYIRGKLGEAMDDSAVRVSLSARLDGAIVGFLMARADLGDFGRADPVAVLDTIGVDPAYGHRGVGHALLSQLFANIGALCIERVETMVRPTELPLLGFLLGTGFTHSQRLAFARPL
jgi:ribosomal protein S18 acetylase RimI-like enzyme